VRIKSIKTYPHPIQRELLLYSGAILADSDFEDDEVIVEKYRGMIAFFLKIIDDPVAYVNQTS
jgi:hypothetical protein